jgi:hypothetical protein
VLLLVVDLLLVLLLVVDLDEVEVEVVGLGGRVFVDRKEVVELVLLLVEEEVDKLVDVDVVKNMVHTL